MKPDKIFNCNVPVETNANFWPTTGTLFIQITVIVRGTVIKEAQCFSYVHVHVVFCLIIIVLDGTCELQHTCTCTCTKI